MTINIALSNVCSAFNPDTIGSKVTKALGFVGVLKSAIAKHDPNNDIVKGQHFIALPEGIPYVSSGVGRREGRGFNAFVVREHRGQMGLYLHRAHAAPVETLHVIVYTIDAYKADPEVTEEEVSQFGADTTHVIVAVLAAAGPRPPMSPERFVSNLAGGNNEALTYSADEIRAMAKEVKAYHETWCVVAD